MPGRILVIDDEPQITRVLRASLSAQGFDVRTANDPEEGLRTFKEWAPDLVITDLMMPGLSGVEVTRAIRMQGATPVLVLSVREHERSKVEALDAGADDYVTKPFGIQELLARVRAHLRRAPERTTSAIEAGDFVVDSSNHPEGVRFAVSPGPQSREGDDAPRAADGGVGSAIGPSAGVFARVCGAGAQETRGRDGETVHPDRAVGGLPVYPRGLERERGVRTQIRNGGRFRGPLALEFAKILAESSSPLRFI
jgi:CheY-like chemotaxis protein